MLNGNFIFCAVRLWPIYLFYLKAFKNLLLAGIAVLTSKANLFWSITNFANQTSQFSCLDYVSLILYDWFLFLLTVLGHVLFVRFVLFLPGIYFTRISFSTKMTCTVYHVFYSKAKPTYLLPSSCSLLFCW